MKKVKFNSKLSLNKETVANLNNSELNEAKGGYSGYEPSCWQACDTKKQCPTRQEPSCWQACDSKAQCE
jgi:natural product precursor